MRKLFSIGFMALAGVLFLSPPVFAGLVEGEVDPINTISAENYMSSDFSGATSLDAGGTDVKVADFTLSDNHQNGWKLTITSANSGKLIRADTITVGDGTSVHSEILYSSVKLVKTGGTLGAALTDPDGSSKAITTGTAIFDTGTASTATTATVAYAANLVISWAADSTLLQGKYRDTLTMSLAVDDD